MAYDSISFEGFDGREDDLRAITRYRSKRPMLYRTNVFQHTQRVLWHLEALLPVVERIYGGEFHVGLARTLALVHDDIEIITDDKERDAKERETPGEREERYREENLAMGTLQNRFPMDVNGHHYGTLLYLSRFKTGIEAQVVKVCDIFDSIGEEIHEVYAGNAVFAKLIDPDITRLHALPEEYPDLRALLAEEHPFTYDDCDWVAIAAEGRPHTAQSIRRPTGVGPYDLWRETILAHGGKRSLVEQKEFMRSKQRPRRSGRS